MTALLLLVAALAVGYGLLRIWRNAAYILPSRLFRVKSLENLRRTSEHTEGAHLKRSLTTFDLTMFGIGAIIGAGIFSAIGTAAAGNLADHRLGAGPAIIYSFILIAIACGFTGLCYAELTSMIPISGSAYTYAYATMGELMAWIIGWDLLLEYAISNVAVAISWGDYCRSFLAEALHLEIPAWLAVDPRSATEMSDAWLSAHHLADQPAIGERLGLLAQARAGALPGATSFTHWDALSTAPYLHGFPLTFNLLAVLITVAVTYLCYIGIKESANANSIMVVIKLIILTAVVLVGVRYIDPVNYHPFAPNGWAGIQSGAAIIFFAYIGFDAVSTCAEECRDPGHDLPRGILYSLGICTVFYILVAIVITGMVPYTQLGETADPLSKVFAIHGMRFFSALISVGALIATAASLLVYQVGQPRIMMSMSRDGLLGGWFGRVHHRYGTPANATLLTGVLVAAPAALMNIGEVVELSNIGTLFAFAIACAGVLILRYKRPDVERRFRVPAVWPVTVLGIFSCGWVAWGLPMVTKIRFVVWLIIGLFLYFMYGVRKSELGRADAAEESAAS